MVKQYGFILFLVLLWVSGAFCKPLEGTRPNILFFLGDDQAKFDSTVYGNAHAPTPVTSRLAEEGLVFEMAFTGQAICAPSRSMLYTGRYPIQNGCFINHTEIRPGIRTLPSLLQDAGYDVILAGKSHVGPLEQFPWTHRFLPVKKEGLPRPWIPIEEIKAYFSSVTNKPFCMIVASEFPHPPHIKKTPFDPDDVVLPPYVYDNEHTRVKYTEAYASIAEKERELDAVLQALDISGLTENTIVFYADDHGTYRGKFTVFDSGLNVAFMVRWPGKIKPGRTDALTSFCDFIPTVLALAGAKEVEGLDGKSLLPVLQGTTSIHHSYVYGVGTNQGIQRRSLFPVRSVHDSRYHYIYCFNSMERLERDRLAGKEISWFRSYGANQFSDMPEVLLFDTQEDPFELNNRAEDPELASVKRRLHKALFEHLTQQRDFLTPDGPLPIFKTGQHPLDESNPKFEYKVPATLEGSLGAALVDPHALTSPSE